MVKSFTKELVSAGCDMNKLSKSALKNIEYIENIENINKPQGIKMKSTYNGLYQLSSMMNLVETREHYKADCKKIIRALELKNKSIEEESYRVKLRDYFDDNNYTNACNCVIILESLTLEEVVSHDADYYRLLRNLHDNLLNLISVQVL